MLERHHVEAWVNRNLWLEEDFEAIVNDIMKCGSDNEEGDFEAIVNDIMKCLAYYLARLSD